MRIVVLDGFTLNPGDNPWDSVARFGDLIVYDRTSPAEIVERSRDAEILIVNKASLSADDMAHLPTLKFIAVTATGFNNIDVCAAARRGVLVSNVPEYGTAAIGQFVFALLLELCHHVGAHNNSVGAGHWSSCPDFSYWEFPLVELQGKRMGIVGFGRIGRKVGLVAHAFGMEVLAADRSAKVAPGYSPFSWKRVDEVFKEADVVSLHCPLTAETEAMVNSKLLSRMKADSFLVNTARGKLVVDRDLADALNGSVIAGAALDVVSEEPIRPDNPLLTARNCIITPHIAWAALAARRRLMAATVDNLAAFLAGNPQNVVNIS